MNPSTSTNKEANLRTDFLSILHRHFKSHTICVVKCRGNLLASFDPSTETPEEGSMTGLTVTDRELGKSVAIPLSTMVNKMGSLTESKGTASASPSEVTFT